MYSVIKPRRGERSFMWWRRPSLCLSVCLPEKTRWSKPARFHHATLLSRQKAYN